MSSPILNKPINRLLAALSIEDYQRLYPHLELVELPQHKILYSVGKCHEYAYFPNHSIIFSMAMMENGSTTEIGVIGNEGMVGLPIILNTGYTNSTAIVQVGGDGYRISAKQLQSELDREGALKTLLMQCVQIRIIQLGQTVACNHYHNLEQRFARWLLTIQDNIQQDEFRLTQKSISQILGDCPTRTIEVVRKIRQQGIIDYHREQIKILDRQGLEKVTCECYQVLKNWCFI